MWLELPLPAHYGMYRTWRKADPYQRGSAVQLMASKATPPRGMSGQVQRTTMRRNFGTLNMPTVPAKKASQTPDSQ